MTEMTTSMTTLEAVRAFYEDTLGGRQVWPTRDGDIGQGVWFLVGSKIIEARDGAAPAPLVLAVDAPEEVAERCWDAGFVVSVRDEESGESVLSVVDPLGRRIELGAHRVLDYAFDSVHMVSAAHA